MKYLIILILLFPFCLNCFSQSDSTISVENKNKLSFVNSLIQKKSYDNAVLFLGGIKSTDIVMADTVNFLKGWAYYYAQSLDKSSYFLTKVSPQSKSYNKARFFSAFNYSFINKTDTAKMLLKQLDLKDTFLVEFRNFQLSGIALLDKDIKIFDSLSSKFTTNFYSITEAEANLVKVRKKLAAYNPKSMVMAGIYSAIVPGLGKLYAGNKEEAFVSFASSVTFALASIESYYRGGSKNGMFITSSILFSFFYIGNIYGSVFTIKHKRNDFYEDINSEIYYNLHLPLRTTFN